MNTKLMEMINDAISNPHDADLGEADLPKVPIQEMIDALQELVKAGVQCEISGVLHVDYRDGR